MFAQSVIIPETVVSIADDAFEGSNIQFIYGFQDSAAQIYADTHSGIHFTCIDDDWLSQH